MRSSAYAVAQNLLLVVQIREDEHMHMLVVEDMRLHRICAAGGQRALPEPRVTCKAARLLHSGRQWQVLS